MGDDLSIVLRLPRILAKSEIHTWYAGFQPNHCTPEGLAMNKSDAAKGGIGLGSVIAVAISWSLNKSILWAIIHGLLGWLYVVYYALIL